MGKQGILLKILMDYFDEAEKDIEEQMKNNLNCEITNRIKEIQKKVSEKKAKRGRENLLFENMGGKTKIECDIKKIDGVLKKMRIDGFKIMEVLDKLEQDIENYSALDSREFKQISSCLAGLYEVEYQAISFSDSGIDRMRRDCKGIWSDDKIKKLYRYWFAPKHCDKEFNKKFLEYINKNQNISFESQNIILEFYSDQDEAIKESDFLNLFRRFDVEREEITFENEKIIAFIKDALDEAVRDAQIITDGIAEEEISCNFETLTEKLLEDFEAYYIEDRSKKRIFYKDNFKALIRYRLYNWLYAAGKEEELYRLIAYKIFFQEFPENICIHPAVELERQVLVGKDVILGEGTHISENSYIGKGVCIYPFETVQTRSDRSKNVCIIIEPRCIIDSSTKIIGEVNIGAGSYVSANLVVTRNIPCNSQYNGKEVVGLDEDSYEKKKISFKRKM